MMAMITINISTFVCSLAFLLLLFFSKALHLLDSFGLCSAFVAYLISSIEQKAMNFMKMALDAHRPTTVNVIPWESILRVKN